MQFPYALAEWTSLLDLFDDETGHALAPILQRVAMAIGKPRTSIFDITGQPDGFDGLSHRGTYERLLVSEWLLAEEAPLEFARRAAVGEHAFLHIARSIPHASFHSAAIIDAGPGQLGTPRIAHLAALIVLARRAEAEGGTFSWCVAQHPTVIYPNVSTATLMSLLVIRSGSEATEERITVARDALSESKVIEETWLIGSRRLERLDVSRSLRCLYVEDVLDPDVRQVRLVVRKAAQPAREVILDLPSDALCTRLLRNPFKPDPVQQGPSPATSSPDRPISNIIHIGPRGIAAVGPEEHTLLYGHIRQSMNSPMKPLKRYDQNIKSRRLLAATRMGRSLLAVWWVPGENKFVAGRLNGSKDFAITGTYMCDFTIDSASLSEQIYLSPLWRSRNSTHESTWYFVMSDGRLVRLTRTNTLNKATVVDGGIHHLQTRDGRAHYLAHHGTDNWRYVSMFDNDTPNTMLLPRQGSNGFVGGPVPSTLAHGLVALEVAEREWKIYRNTESQTISIPTGIVRGVMMAHDHQEALLIVQKSERTIHVMHPGQGTSFSLPTAPEDIAHVALDENQHLISYSTVWGAIVVYSLVANEVIHEHRPRFLGGGSE